MTVLPYRDLVTRLKSLGLSKAQVGALMPSWWDDTAAATGAGAWEFALLISRRLGLDAVALARGEVRPLGEVSEPRFKHTARVTPEELGPAARIAAALAKAIVAAMPERAPVHADTTAAQVREAILSSGAGRIDFDSLLNFAWQQGIAVIPLPNLPKGVKKMDAAALRVDGRPVIVISRKSDSKAWLSFILAHELGHLLLGHVPDNGSIVEGSIQDTAKFEAESQLDVHEREANAFAHAVLAGDRADAAVRTWSPRANMLDLVELASAAAPPLHSAPGQLILRYAFLNQAWAEAAMALRFLADDVEAQDALITRLGAEIDTGGIGDDLQEFVEQVTGISRRAA
jgi:hypothetical protein